MGGHRLLAAALAATIGSAAAPALGYCRTTTCGPGECTADPACEHCLVGGKPLFWAGGCLSFSVHELGSPLRGIDSVTTKQIVTDAFVDWISVDCGGGQTPGLSVYEFPVASCGQPTFDEAGPNANVWMFRDDTWPYPSSQLALTTVTFDIATGQLFDADVELNSVENAFTTGDGEVQYDLKSIVVHEAGHFIGLAHSCEPGATMVPTFQLGDTSLRTLETDDAIAVCTVYPPGSDDPACDPKPYNGFTSPCSGSGGASGGTAGVGGSAVGGSAGTAGSVGGSGAIGQTQSPGEKSGCSCRAPGTRGGGSAWSALLALSLLSALARRRALSARSRRPD